MLDERRFVRSYSSFWRDTLPYCEVYLRHLNAEYAEVYDAQFRSSVDPNRRAIVNEFAFALFRASLKREGVDELVTSHSDVEQVHRTTLAEMQRFGAYGLPLGPLSIHERSESFRLARRTESFFSRHDRDNIIALPNFPGCGTLDEVQGDIFVDGNLYEVKAGARAFRGVDLRQLLTYCALNVGVGAHKIERVGLVNPRTGTYFTEKLGVVCVRVSGEPTETVLGRITQFLSGALASP